jgi:probable HAF family extracellular repeat protein
VKSRILCITAMTLFAALAIPLWLAAQDSPDHHQQHQHYKLIDIGTFGGPNSSVGFESSPLNALSSQGIFAACADTSVPNPEYPNFNPVVPGIPGTPQPDPLIFHALQWKNGKLTDLGALPGGNNSCATHISGNGLIVGASENGTIDPLTGWPEVQAVLWRNNHIINLGTLGGNESFPLAVNNRGQVVGQAANAIPDPFPFPGFGQQARAFLWQRGAMQDLGTLGGPDAFAININERGQVLGFSFINSIPNSTTGFPTGDGFLWENGEMTDIPDPLGGTIVSPFYLSNKGEVLGSADLPGDIAEQEHPFLWEKGVFTDLGTFGGTRGHAVKINDAGQIVGDANFAGDATWHASIWQNGVMSDLGTVGSDGCSVGYDINSRGQAVGYSGACDGSSFRAFLREKGGPMVDLNTLIPVNSGIFLFIATNINDRGEIAGSGVLPNGDVHAVLLTRCGENDSDGQGCEDAESTPVASQNSSPSILQNQTTLTQSNPATSHGMVAIRSRLARPYPSRDFRGLPPR